MRRLHPCPGSYCESLYPGLPVRWSAVAQDQNTVYAKSAVGPHGIHLARIPAGELAFFGSIF
jgi:hypothetical protein